MLRVSLLRAAAACVLLNLPIVGVAPAMAEPVMDRAEIQSHVQDLLGEMHGFFAQGDINDLRERLKDYTHDKTVMLFQYQVDLAETGPGPRRNAHFNRDPFLDMLSYASMLSSEHLKYEYELKEFQPLANEKAAILKDESMVFGRYIEPITGLALDFTLTQTCRHTITAYDGPPFRFDSIHCRADIATTSPSLSKAESGGAL